MVGKLLDRSVVLLAQELLGHLRVFQHHLLIESKENPR